MGRTYVAFQHEVSPTNHDLYVAWSDDDGATWSAPVAVGAYIAAAYWFTASTSFANPAVTLARGFTATFSGIDPSGIPAFVLAQIAGAGLAVWLSGSTNESSG